eukprot:TRINITY_DN1968_c0_g2_i2.p1 TRINITY_DN1968_c0_g2~~TRINITY_DN1968_c0_g2_i2.p1  ORF type:complete len:622 (+),score=92.85 TRINITY_DN1968_c0_g2_i2:55-1866(+)
MTSVLKVSVIGGGSFGTAVACVAAQGVRLLPEKFSPEVSLWVRRAELAEEINTQHSNKQYWPGEVEKNIVAETDIGKVVRSADICIVALPADFLDSVLPALRESLPPAAIIVSTLKSLKVVDGEVVPYSRYLAAELPGHVVASLMGPNLYKEMARVEFAEATLGVNCEKTGAVLSQLFNTANFNVSLVTDVEAVDTCACMKNTFTLACGFAEGLGWGGNVRASIIRRGMLEIKQFLAEFLPSSRPGSMDPTSIILEACGIGDLILSCTVGRGRALAAEFVKHDGKKDWADLERDTQNGMKIPDWHNLQYVHNLLLSKKRTAAYPLLEQTYAIAFGGAEPSSIKQPLCSGRSDAEANHPVNKKTKEPMALHFRGRVALVTGAASGIGRAIAVALATQGIEVKAVDRDHDSLLRLHQEFPNCAPLRCDLADIDSMRRMVESAGPIDMLVNAAGIAIFEVFGEQSPDTWDKTMDINARAVWFLTQELGKQMAERQFGAVVNISSQSSSIVVSDKHMAYSTSKAAVDHVTRMASYALAKSNVRVNAVNPTVVRTELAIKAHGEEGLKKMAAKVPLGRVCEPTDVADAVLFLLSDEARMITGVALPVD